MFKKILALHTGGTISMAADDSGAVITNEVNPMTQVTSPIEGIAVTSENSRALVKYLHDAENLNFDVIPSKKSVSRLGWVGDDGFSPYVDGLVFDGEEAFKSFFNSVKQKGNSKNGWT